MRIALAGLVLAGLVGLPASSATAAADETCQGKPVTIVGGISGATGTEGDDVILVETDSTSLSETRGLGGDDTICISGPLPVDRGPEDIVSFVDGGPGADSLEVLASRDEDDLEVYDVEQVDLWLGGGDDRLVIRGVTLPGSALGGAGHNRLTVSTPTSLVADLEDETLVLGGAKQTMRGFQKVRAGARRVELTGSAAAETLQAVGCRVELRGGRGNDFLTAGSYGDPKVCVDKGALVLGQKGDDRMRGTSRNDRLLGGPGRDRANGKGGNDRCDAEIETGCER